METLGTPILTGEVLILHQPVPTHNDEKCTAAWGQPMCLVSQTPADTRSVLSEWQGQCVFVTSRQDEVRGEPGMGEQKGAVS